MRTQRYTKRNAIFSREHQSTTLVALITLASLMTIFIACQSAPIASAQTTANVNFVKGKSNNMNQSKKSGDENSTNLPERTATVQRYIQAWNELPPAELQTLLKEVWTADSTYEDPLTAELRGFDELVGHIQKFKKLKPGTRMELNSKVDEYHGLGRFNWILYMPDGTTGYGTDFVEFDENNRLRRVIGFPTHLPRQQASGQSVEQSIKQYVRAWNEKGVENIKAALEKCWTADTIFTDPKHPTVKGLDALVKAIQASQTAMPGRILSQTSKADFHHNSGTYQWVLTQKNGTTAKGSTYFEYNSENKLTRVVAFF